jgi:hypothetical protein
MVPDNPKLQIPPRMENETKWNNEDCDPVGDIVALREMLKKQAKWIRKCNHKYKTYISDIGEVCIECGAIVKE